MRPRTFHKYPVSVVISCVMALIITVACQDSSPRDFDLRELDAAVANVSGVSDSRKFADSLAKQASTLAGTPGEADAHTSAGEAYAAVDLHKALDHTLAAVRLSVRPGVAPDVKDRALLRLAFLYNSQGYMTKETSEIFNSLNPEKMDSGLREQYYVLGVQLYSSLGRRSLDKTLSDRYNRMASLYRDSVLALAPGRTAILSNRYLAAGHKDSAEMVLAKALESESPLSAQSASLNYNLAQVYLQQDETEQAARCLAMAALSDLRRGVKNYRSLPQLALLLLENGDTERAYRYIHRSSDDAAEAHATRRQLEMASDLAAIDAVYAAGRTRRWAVLAGVLLFVLILAISILAALVMMRRKNAELRASATALAEANGSLVSANEDVKRLNERLDETGRIKQRYLTSFMELCLSYLKKMESFRAELAKTAAKGDLQALAKAINSSRYVNREVAEFYDNFDKAFLSLYPDFIDRLNSLLREECRYAHTESFSTELRIYALIWLGVTSSNEMARFLRCSESTVYNYRTQMRNRASDRAGFEEDVLRSAREYDH